MPAVFNSTWVRPVALSIPESVARATKWIGRPVIPTTNTGRARTKAVATTARPGLASVRVLARQAPPARSARAARKSWTPGAYAECSFHGTVVPVTAQVTSTAA
ncbi:hypothetical protein Slala02_29340 [Streptomyces lavendulae subsp. lavendulae]|nr:hypothetical protein Slala01_32630 [Streptomyces lavendulae subsp. lavendulae]GLX27114.1 hypothetical protein Slala02_29340 [Streptomyces lavendulae subsp. lavendulae]